jgi:putative two-component system response regulator
MKKIRVLVVDDDQLSRRQMRDMLTPLGYEVSTAENGVQGLEKVRADQPDLVFLDVVMPAMDGFETCEMIKKDSRTEHIPVVLITVLDDRESRISGLGVGANDFLSKPVDPVELTTRARNLLKVKEFEDFLQKHNEELDTRVKEQTSQLRETLEELRQSKEELKKSYLDTIFKLTAVAEYKDGFTADHIKKVGAYCRLLAAELGWSEVDRQIIYYSSPMHDIGKVVIPSEILLKPGRLTPEEFALTRTHTTAGADILRGSTSEYLQMAEEIALTHHERWSGDGYPRGLREEEIPSAGRIMNLVDQYDALRSERPYKTAFNRDKTFKIISEGDGRTEPGHFEPRVLEAFRDSHLKFDEIYNNSPD